MSVSALLTNQWSGMTYGGYAKSSSKGKEFSGKWIAEVAPELMKAEAEKRKANDENAAKPVAPLTYSRRISAKFKTEELIANNTENGETIYSYQASAQQFEIMINVNGDERKYFIKGIDGEGNVFEKEFDPYEVDPENTDYTEFTALCLYIQRTDGYADSLMSNFVQPDNILEKRNYFGILETWGNEQAQSGNPELYDNAMRMLIAIRAFMEKSLSVSGRNINIEIEKTKGTYSGGDPQKLPKVFYTYYSPEGMKCIREGERNPADPEEKIGDDTLQWEIKFTDPKQYDRVMEFLAEFPEEDNLRFTTNEKFWNDFLNDKIDMEGFREFYAWTDHGVPHMNKTEEGGHTGINRERILNPNSGYFNDWTWIRNVWTEEEMWANWYASIGMKKTPREYRL